MHDYSNKNMHDEEKETIIECTTMAVIIGLTSEIDAYERKHPDMSENDVLRLVMSKKWYYMPKIPDFPSWRDWFVAMTFNRAIEYLSGYKLTEEELSLVKNLICKTVDELRFWKSKGGYYSYRIGFREFISE